MANQGLLFHFVCRVADKNEDNHLKNKLQPEASNLTFVVARPHDLD
jgi:hypothetical protein